MESEQDQKSEINQLDKLRNQIENMSAEIFEKMGTLDEMNDKFKEKQEQSFLKTFVKIMDRMSEELKIAQQKYKNIDIEILKDRRVMKLERQIYFFREECLILAKQLQVVKKELSDLKAKKEILDEQTKVQYFLLVKKEKQNKRIQNKLSEVSRIHTKQKSFFLTKSKQHTLKNSDEQNFDNMNSQRISQLNMMQRINRAKNANKKQKTNILLEDRKSFQTMNTKQQKIHQQKNQQNELLSLWQKCINDMRQNEKNLKYFSKSNRKLIFENFLSNEKIFQLLKNKIFDIKCCNHHDCLNNGLNALQHDQSEDKISRIRIASSRPRIKTSRSNKASQSRVGTNMLEIENGKYSKRYIQNQLMKMKKTTEIF